MSNLRELMLERIAECNQTLERLDAVNQQLEPLVSSVLGRIIGVKERYGLDAKTIALDCRLFNYLARVIDVNEIKTLWSIPVTICDDSFFDCYVLTLEDGATITCGFELSRILKQTVSSTNTEEIERARQLVIEVAARGDSAFRMSIPANVDDSDNLLLRVLDRAGWDAKRIVELQAERDAFARELWRSTPAQGREECRECAKSGNPFNVLFLSIVEPGVVLQGQ